jgi:hypothetical protein
MSLGQRKTENNRKKGGKTREKVLLKLDKRKIIRKTSKNGWKIARL